MAIEPRLPSFTLSCRTPVPEREAANQRRFLREGLVMVQRLLLVWDR